MVANVITDIVDKFGWPGAVVLFAASIFVIYGSPEQKRYAIDVYLLGKTTPGAAAIAAVFFVLVLLAQMATYRKTVGELRQMLRRSEEKSDRLTEQLANAKNQIASGHPSQSARKDVKGISATSGSQ